jgi:hypothetical protein
MHADMRNVCMANTVDRNEVVNDFFMVKLLRAQGGCLGIGRR